MDWILDPSFSTIGPEIDRLYYIILVITGVVFLVTEILLIYLLIRYRKKEGRKAAYIHGSTKAEVIWTAVPFVIVIALALMSRPVWDRAKNPAFFPEDAFEIHMSARQFEWEATYAGADGEFGTATDFNVLNRMHVPVNRPVLVQLSAEDVIHSFFVPEFRVKQDAVPGMVIPLWFEVTEPGEYTLACAELCGTGHFQMDGIIVAQSDADFEAWHAERVAQAGGVPSAVAGPAPAASPADAPGDPAPDDPIEGEDP